MATLPSDLRRQLENTVVAARDIAEAGAQSALEALAIPHGEAHRHMSSEHRGLRKRLRVHARHLGDRVETPSGVHTIDHLIHECAYEHWHGMLFARFLAENQLLIEPEMEIAITLDECAELARRKAIDKWVLAARFAHCMLPQVFRPDNPVFAIALAREHRLKLEDLIETLPPEVFAATDALGWVYQFWQTKKKDEVNYSEVKIGANELPAVTQLFTEPYMVQFLLHNSLGAWWVSRHPAKPCPVALTYLRKSAEGVPAAGEFEAWPHELAELRVLDPCCGSGHFLIAAFLMLVPMRMVLDQSSAADAVDAVLRENLHGLEIDQRCVALAAFALALEAWRFPNAGGFRPLPRFNLAWCGQPVAGNKQQWLALAAGDPKVEGGMATLYDTFRDAPTLGSLISPSLAVRENLLTASLEELQPLLETALQEPDTEEGKGEREATAIAALGLTDAAQMLCSRYHLVITNVPYLSRRKQRERLRTFSDACYPRAKHDLANVFLERCLELAKSDHAGVTQIVMPQNWLFLTSYRAQREELLKTARWHLLARLGAGAFETIGGAVVKSILFTLSRGQDDTDHNFLGIDVSQAVTISDKKAQLQCGTLELTSQSKQQYNPDARVLFGPFDYKNAQLLAESADYGKGSTTGDALRFLLRFWEFPRLSSHHVRWLNSPSNSDLWSGRTQVLKVPLNDKELNSQLGCWLGGHKVFSRPGMAVKKMGKFEPLVYSGEAFDDNICPICPTDKALTSAIAAYVQSGKYHAEVRRVDQALKVTAATLVKVPFDYDHWTAVARQCYPHGLPRPYTDDATQWIFHGHPCGAVAWDEGKKWTAQGPLRTSETVLQIAVARLLAYRWPAEHDPDMDLDDEQRAWVERGKALHPLEDADGIVCIAPSRGEPPAHEPLLQLLQAAYGDEWHDDTLRQLLAESGSGSLDDWLRTRFFIGHCQLFHQRPFIWHIWDGRKRDGFHALVNYHKLAEGEGGGRRRLESLTHSYLGDWIIRQEDGVKRGEGGAEDRLVAALELQKRLIAILQGEPPFDLFVRWKPLDQQPIGWEPDINDGVRINIRPFMARDLPGGRKDAGILRSKPHIHWKRDRGNEIVRDEAQFPWFWKNGKFTRRRVNDMHFTNAEKRGAREMARGDQS